MEAKIKEEGCTLKFVQDQDAESPREWDNAGVMVCWHRRYNLGDKHQFSTPQDFDEWWKENGKGGEILPLYLYDHSGITMRTGPFNCPWDSGQVGWIYATAEKIREEWGKRITKKRRALAREVLKGEVETYDQFLTGDVWGYVIEDEDGEEVESCWGFFGHKYAEEEGKSAFEHYTDKAKANRLATEAADATEQTEQDVTV